MQSEQESFIGIFREEAAEHIQHLHRGLLALQQHPQDETLLEGTSRAADTLLGSAMTMGFEAVSQQARTMRDRLIDAREGNSPLDTAALDRLLQGLAGLCADVDTEVGGGLGDAIVGASFATVMTLRTSLEALHHNLMRLPDHPRDAAFVQHVCALARTLREHTETGGFDAMAQVAQRTEDIMRAAAEGGIHLNEDELGMLLQGLGFIELLLDAAVTGDEGEVVIDNLCAMLENILSTRTSESVHAVPESQPGPEMPTPSEAAPREVIPQEGVKATAKVLIASNSPLFSRKLSSMLSQAQHEVILASNAEEVIGHLQRKDIDLCLLRDALPQGFDICEQFAKLSQTDDAIPIILYSPQSRVKTRALESGAADFLKVPCQPQELMALVERWGKRAG